MIHLWQEERGKEFYRLQTDEKTISDKLKRRNGFQLIGSSLNSKSFWLYRCQFSRPDIAKKTFKGVADGRTIKIDSEGLLSVS